MVEKERVEQPAEDWGSGSVRNMKILWYPGDQEEYVY